MNDNGQIRDDALALLAEIGSGMEISARESTHMCELAQRYGKLLSPDDVKGLYAAREAQLRDTGRVEFGAGALPHIVYALCDSEFIDADEFADKTSEFAEIFYTLKNECGDELTDDELIDALADYFNDCEGDMQQTADAGFAEILGRRKRD